MQVYRGLPILTNQPSTPARLVEKEEGPRTSPLFVRLPIAWADV